MKKNEIINPRQERQKTAELRRAKTETCRFFFSPMSQPPKRIINPPSRYVE